MDHKVLPVSQPNPLPACILHRHIARGEIDGPIAFIVRRDGNPAPIGTRDSGDDVNGIGGRSRVMPIRLMQANRDFAAADKPSRDARGRPAFVGVFQLQRRAQAKAARPLRAAECVALPRGYLLSNIAIERGNRRTEGQQTMDPVHTALCIN
jgi:hypothetical protein